MTSIRPWRDIARRTSRQIMVGSVPVGGDAPITVQTMTNTLQRLEAAGLVTSRPDPSDGRAKIITITNAGRAMRQRCIEAQAPLLSELGDRLPETDLATLLPGLRQVRILLDTARDT